MVSYSIILFFVILVLVFFLSCSNLLISLVVLEALTFLVLWMSVSVLGSYVSISLTLGLFCIFILESVLGLVGLLNFINFSGSDYVNISVFL